MVPTIKKSLSWFKARPQARKRFDEKELRQLGESLKVRQLHPLVCLPEGTIIAGERRYRAALLVGMTELEVKIIDDPVTEAECKRLQFTENMQRQDLTGHEQWQGCVELLRLNPGWTQKDLAEQLHIDPSMVVRLLSPSKCIDSVQAAFAGGRIGISDCYAISRLGQTEQAAALAMKLSGASRDQLASHARRQRSGDKPSVRINRIKCELGGDVSIVITGNALGLDEVIEALSQAHKEARKARDQNIDVKTWAAVMRDRARKGG
ncbi:MAG TPA: ParB/RepB/Spo0J family partition protein [Gemmataceae bacterium]|nr:ParB/RepB/Spo0J family partition protein [Gemmataceae bacterium]